jgi:hypothetical protein
LRNSHRLFDLRQPEIKELHALLGDEDIRRFQIAMRNTLAVRRIERVADLRGGP